jgi:hypothetical protein
MFNVDVTTARALPGRRLELTFVDGVGVTSPSASAPCCVQTSDP